MNSLTAALLLSDVLTSAAQTCCSPCGPVANYKLVTMFYWTMERHNNIRVSHFYLWEISCLSNWHIEDQISIWDFSILSSIKYYSFVRFSCYSLEWGASNVGMGWCEALQINHVLNHHSIREEGEWPLAS